MTRAGRTGIVLFTRDLRVHDQPGLAEAAGRMNAVVPLFVLDDRLLRDAGTANRVSFLLDSLRDLRTSLRRLGADLVLRRGDTVDETLRVAAEVGAGTVFVGADASEQAQERERKLARGPLDVRVGNAVTAVPPGALAPADRNHYRVFTPYWRQWQAAPLRPATPPPRRLRLPSGVSVGRLPGLGALVESKPSPDLARGGETEARRRLGRWLADGLAHYGETRDELAADATSRLSPYLHFGCLSALELVHRARAAGVGAEPFVRQLCWRDFYTQLLAANPQTPRESLHQRGDRWRDDGEALDRWRAGLTGYPIVDAAMRQLRREGWMHNRARLIVGSFLTKTLYLDWRHGARAFAELLVDADVANNVGNWQWVAGTGVDSRPNRVLNPIAQARRLDPAGAYVRRYVPELGNLEGAAIHEPWRAPLTTVAPEYPAPIVDYEEATARFRAARGGKDGTA